MGSVSSTPNQDEFTTLSSLPQHLRKMELKFDINKEIEPNLKQLLHWSILEIRGVYEQFQRRTNIPFIDKSLFCKIMPFTRTNSNFIFEHFCKTSKLLSIYELMCVLTITAYTHYINKVHFLYLLFDLDCSGNISLNELLIIFKSIVMGYCKLTGAELPSYLALEKFAKLMFLKSDIQVDNALELNEIIEWLETNQKAMELFLMYDPKTKIQEPFEAFRPFKPYTEQEGNEMLDMITKANKNEYFYKGLNDMVGKKNKVAQPEQNRSQLVSKTQSLPKISTLQKVTQHDDEQDEMNMLEKALDQHQKRYEGQQVKPKSKVVTPQLGEIRKKATQLKLSKNIIITRGCTLTRNEIFKLKDYFDKLSDKNININVKDFTKAFTEKPHMKRVIASLFNFLDTKQHGLVTFEQLLLKMYPTLTRQQLDLINFWIKQYNDTFLYSQRENLEMELQNEKQQVRRKRVLPKSCMIRIKQLFQSVDLDNKGYINQDDLKKAFTYGYSAKEVEDLFNQHDLDQDGKLRTEDFIRIILPADYVIEDEGDEQQ